MSDSFHIKRIHCENFMPYHNQTIEFPDKDGVIIISGVNGAGKTSLVSAIRFVLFGRINSNTSDEISPMDTLFEAVNTEGRKKGLHSCKVTLDIEYLGDDFKIIRTFSPKPGVTNPKTPLDYDTPRLEIVSGSRVLNETQREQLLTKVMSENVSRFYLFDGELLDEYKKILFAKKRTLSNKMRAAIEDILGLPLLTNTRDHLSVILNEKQEALQAATKENNQTVAYGRLLDEAKNRLESYKNGMMEAGRDIETCQLRIEELERSLSQNRENLLLIDKKKLKQSELDKLRVSLEKKKEIHAANLVNAWSVLLSPLLYEKYSVIDTKYKSLVDINTRYSERQKLQEEFTKALDAGYCDRCGQKLTAEALESIKEKLSEIVETSDYDVDIESLNSQMLTLSGNLSFISKFRRKYPSNLKHDITLVESDICDTQNSITDLEIEIEGIKRQLSEMSVGSSELEAINAESVKEGKKLAGYESAYDDCEAKYNKEVETIKSIEAKISQFKGSNKDLDKAVNEKNEVSKLVDLFELSIDKYRQEKRAAVEEITSALYRRLCSVKWVGGLHITEDYSVQAYDPNGSELPNPSAGYAHLAAFALIGGLHRNVPIKGPLFMDTPSGRIDGQNTMNLITVMPDLSNQVILLTHDKEFSLPDLRTLIGNKIVAEYEIHQISQTSSVIKRHEGGEN